MEDLTEESIKNLEEEKSGNKIIKKDSFLRRESTFENSNYSKEDKYK